MNTKASTPSADTEPAMHEAVWLARVREQGVRLMRLHNSFPNASYLEFPLSVGSVMLAAIAQGLEPPRNLRTVGDAAPWEKQGTYFPGEMPVLPGAPAANFADRHVKESAWLVKVNASGVSLVRMHDNMPSVAYPHVNHAVGAVWLAAIGQGLEPPFHIRALEPVDRWVMLKEHMQSTVA